MSRARYPNGTLPEAVQWHEGMLLSPHHMQQEALRVEKLVNHQFQQVAPYPWGVSAVEIDETALLAGIFRLTRLHGMLPDGMVIDYPGASSDPLELPLAKIEIDLQRDPAFIHLAVAAPSERSAAEGELRRFLSVESDPVFDLNTGDNPATIPRLRPKLGLVATGSAQVGPGPAYMSMPVAKLGSMDGKVALMPFQPPLLYADEGMPLYEVAREIAVEARDKAVGLVERLRGAAVGEAVETAESMIMLRAVTTPLLRLEALLRDKVVSPYWIYLALCDFLASVAATDLDLAPPVAPHYDHDDPLPAFIDFRTLIFRALEGLKRDYTLYAFKEPQEGVFTLEGAEFAGQEALFLILYAAPGQAVVNTAQWAAEAYMATSDALPRLEANRIRGAHRNLIEKTASLNLTAPRDTVMIELSLDQRFITQGQALEVRHPEGAGQAGQPVRIAWASPNRPRGPVPSRGPAVTGKTSDEAASS